MNALAPSMVMRDDVSDGRAAALAPAAPRSAAARRRNRAGRVAPIPAQQHPVVDLVALPLDHAEEP